MQLTFKPLYHQPSLLYTKDRRILQDLISLLQDGEATTDPTNVFKKKLDALLGSAVDRGTITRKELKFMTVEKPTCPTFYMLPKVHKCLEVPPERTVDFLDLRLDVVGNTIQTSLFRKSTATNSLLHYGSFHPRHLRNGIPTGQFLRIRRNCTDLQTFELEARNLTERLRTRGYPKKVISKAYQRAKGTDRSHLFRPKPRGQDNKRDPR
ncbi:uncharacterized protein [Dendropsophus ebraccatus]|uniref:uncharacterized protein n=1 Tax=Dendropsophus ebraccatus TaxID=150705 RepID=UPI0038314B05